MPASLDHQERMLVHLSGSEGHEFGRTAADALAFLEKTDTVVVSVRVGLDWPCSYLAFPTAAIRAAIAAYPAGDALPSEYEPANRTLTLGTVTSIIHAERSA